MNARWLCVATLVAACDGTAPDSDQIGQTDQTRQTGQTDSAVVDAGLDAAGFDDAAPMPDGAFDAGPDALPPGPIRLWVGVNGIPEDMLGTVPARVNGRNLPFQWTLPPAGWTLDVTMVHGEGWAPSAPPRIIWRSRADAHIRVVIEPDAVDPPGGQWTEVRDGHVWSARITAPLTEGTGGFSLQAALDELVSEPLSVDVAELTPALDPFDHIDPWLVTFSRDTGHLVVEPAGAEFTVTTEAADGTPDFEEALAALGLLGGDAIWREGLLSLTRARVKERMRAFFHLDDAGEDAVRMRLYFEGDADAESPEPEWSRIAIGGEDPSWTPGSRAFFGRADIDWNNQRINDNTGPTRGVFTTTFVRYVLANPLISGLAREHAPAAGGRPFGAEPGDVDLLAPDFAPESIDDPLRRTRAERFLLIVDYLTLAVAAVTAHEIGHSLGLVKPGLPPVGLLGGIDGPWIVQSTDPADAHIDTPGFNLMQTGSQFDLADAVRGQPEFNAPNLAYLRRRLVIRPD